MAEERRVRRYPVGVVLDVDGVLHSSGRPISGSAEAVRVLLDKRIPFAFLTNAGGSTEAQKAASISKLLDGVPISPCQVVLAHTPYRHIAPQYKGKRVLVIGNEACVEAARSYGFDEIVHAKELQMSYPELVPFKEYDNKDDAQVAAANKARHLAKPVDELRAEIEEALKVEAVFFFDSVGVDGLNDVQVAVDALMSGPDVPFYMQAEDDVWAASPSVSPRLGESLFRRSLESAFQMISGRPLPIKQFGKPRRANFAEAEIALRSFASELLGSSEEEVVTFDAIYMVGDNIHVDILGANAMGSPWRSVHVLTGVGVPPFASRFACPAGAIKAAQWGDLEHAALHQQFEANVVGGVRPHITAPCLLDFVTASLHS